MNFSFVARVRHRLASYWKIFLVAGVQQGHVRRAEDEEVRGRSSRTDDGKHFHREQMCEPSTPIPGFLQSVVKSTGYTEIDDLDWGTNVMRVKIETAMFKDRFAHARRLHRHAARRRQALRREFKGEVKVSVPLIGGQASRSS